MGSEHQSLNPEEIRDLLRRRYPGLTLMDSDDGYVVEGTHDLIEGGEWVESYLIRMRLPPDYPRSMPIVHEIGGRIPASVDFHVNAGTAGSLCLGVPEELWLEYNGRFDVELVLDGPLNTYLLGVTEKLQGREWPYGEREHGSNGLCQFYGGVIGSTDPIHVLNLIHMLGGSRPKGHWACPCGSGKRLRSCHNSSVLELFDRALPHKMLARSAKLVAASPTSPRIRPRPACCSS